jgi:hypothetical protein
MKQKKMKPKGIILTLIVVFGALLTITLFISSQNIKDTIQTAQFDNSKLGVCPPFFMLTEDGDTINPKHRQTVFT